MTWAGQDFAKLIMAGWVPAGLTLGISIGARHDDRSTTRQVRWGIGNAEVVGWTEIVNESRHEARRQLEGEVRRLGAEGVVIAAMQLRVSQRDARSPWAAATTLWRSSTTPRAQDS